MFQVRVNEENSVGIQEIQDHFLKQGLKMSDAAVVNFVIKAGLPATLKQLGIVAPEPQNKTKKGS